MRTEGSLWSHLGMLTLEVRVVPRWCVVSLTAHHNEVCLKSEPDEDGEGQEHRQDVENQHKDEAHLTVILDNLAWT